MSQFSLEQLTEGIRARHLGSQGRQLVDKWSRTGLLRGLESTKREHMARLLENQASQVLRGFIGFDWWWITLCIRRPSRFHKHRFPYRSSCFRRIDCK